MIILYLTFLSNMIDAQQQEQYFALIYTTGSAWNSELAPNEQPYFREHSKHLAQLRKADKIAIGARYSDKGLIILKVKDKAEADSIIASDTSIKYKTFKAELYPFNAFYTGTIENLNTTKTIPMKTYSAIQNFQIPVSDFERAHSFYSKVMNYELNKMEYGNSKLALFQFDQRNGIGGTLIKSEGLEPSKKGTMIYLHAGNDLQPFLERVRANGGQVINEKTPLGPDMGYFAIFDDTEGNRVGLYSKD